MRVLSLFDGISCGRVALERAGIAPSVYFASEIEKSAMRISARNYPNIIQLGCVRQVARLAEAGVFGAIDLLMGGSPCQGFSRAGAELNFADPRSALFFEYVRVKNATNPRWFLLENVDMKVEWRDVITSYMGVQPVCINSRDFSAQNRKRWYWTNIPIASWADKKITLADVFGRSDYTIFNIRKPNRPKIDQYKSGCLTGASGNSAGNSSDMDVVKFGNIPCFVNSSGRIAIHYHHDLRRYTVNECEKLQTLSEGYCDGVSQSASYRALANGWTVDVIAHILKGMV